MPPHNPALSRTVTCLMPARVRWNARLAPITPAPMMIASALPGTGSLLPVNGHIQAGLNFRGTSPYADRLWPQVTTAVSTSISVSSAPISCPLPMWQTNYRTLTGDSDGLLRVCRHPTTVHEVFRGCGHRTLSCRSSEKIVYPSNPACASLAPLLLAESAQTCNRACSVSCIYLLTSHHWMCIFT